MGPPECNWPIEIIAVANLVAVQDGDAIDGVWKRTTKHHPSRLTRDTGLDVHGFLCATIDEARRRGLLPRLVSELIQAELVDPEVLGLTRKLFPEEVWMLQAVVRDDLRSVDALPRVRHVLQAFDYVCRIDIKGVHHGSGVLVSPSLVATAAHVVESLVVRDEQGMLKARPNSHETLGVTFGYLEPGSDSGELAAVHRDWLVKGSPPAAGEPGGTVDDVTGVDPNRGPWDYALIRLAAPRNRCASVATVPLPRKPFQIHLMHHPRAQTDTRGSPMQWAEGVLDHQLGEPASPPLRFLHNAGTSPGSSGAPVLDNEWQVVALHQGGPDALQDTGPTAPAGSRRNRAVPVLTWATGLDGLERSLGDEESFLRYPFLGRGTTQRSIARARWAHAPPADRLLIVRGEPGSGLRFTKRIVTTVLAGSAVIRALDISNALADDAAEVARLLADSRSASLGEVARRSEVTTTARHVLANIGPAAARALTADGETPLWLLIDGFASAGHDTRQGVHDLVQALVAQLNVSQALRVVLIGWVDAPPPGFEQSVEDLELPTAADVVYSLTKPGERVDPLTVTAMEMALANLPATLSSVVGMARNTADGLLAKELR